MKTTRTILLFLAAFAMTACSSDPQWVDEEAHENTEQLRELYTPIIVGTWHVEYIKDKGRFFERLTFSADGTFTGMRKWQTRKLVTIDGKEQYTDWQEKEDYNGTFTGTWKLSWERDKEGAPGANRLWLSAVFDENHDRTYYAYDLNALFIHADKTTISFTGGFVPNGDNGESVYTRGDAEPSFWVK